jgi:hypothetical protein
MLSVAKHPCDASFEVAVHGSSLECSSLIEIPFHGTHKFHLTGVLRCAQDDKLKNGRGFEMLAFTNPLIDARSA